MYSFSIVLAIHLNYRHYKNKENETRVNQRRKFIVREYFGTPSAVKTQNLGKRRKILNTTNKQSNIYIIVRYENQLFVFAFWLITLLTVILSIVVDSRENLQLCNVSNNHKSLRNALRESNRLSRLITLY